MNQITISWLESRLEEFDQSYPQWSLAPLAARRFLAQYLFGRMAQVVVVGKGERDGVTARGEALVDEIRAEVEG